VAIDSLLGRSARQSLRSFDAPKAPLAAIDRSARLRLAFVAASYRRCVLEELQLRGLGVIEDATLELGPGFTAITGETGAGKTMLLTGLGLLLGGRADAAAVRRGHDRADVDGRFRVQPDGRAARRATDAGADLDEDGGTLVVSRAVAAGDAAGRSRSFLGGRPVPVSVLGELAEDLVAVHGQADQRGLLRPAVQRRVLDRYAGAEAADALAAYRSTFSELAAVRAELAEVTTRRRERMQEADLLRLGLAEISAVAPVPGEERELRNLVERLSHVDLLTRVASSAHEALAGAEDATATDALGLLGSARRALDEARGYDATLDDLAGRLSEATYLLADVAADLASYAAGTEADPAKLAHAQQRLADLTGLTRKYAPDVDGVIAWGERAAARLSELDGDDDRVEALTATHTALLADLADKAGRLSAVRTAAGDRLARAVGEELAALAMPQARLVVAVDQRPDEHGLDVAGPDGRVQRVAFGPHGVDEVELLLVAHPDAPPRPLHRGASGGELSRLMLAIEVVLAGTDPVPTFVFDEVDAGVGGAAAVEVGRRLALLARSAQVVVVTHLPQVAAFADAHLVVARSGNTTTVVPVDGQARLEELSRMLGGMADSDLGRGHAQELLTAAADSKAAVSG
jgi:DNA repair protein RecN (Recombination protein N)